MKNLFSLVFLLFAIFSISKAQVVITPSLSPSYYVQNVLMGNYVGISNVSSTCTINFGGVSSLGEFHTFTIPNSTLNDGILFSTGDINITVGPNSSSSSSTNLNLPGDSMLNLLVSYPTYDAAVLEFDYVPFTNVLNFQYIFASEEYPEYVGSSFNDIFGFYVSGPNPYGGNYINKNIAIIPGTTNSAVSINNINNGASNSGPCVNCQYYVQNTGSSSIIFDGYTAPLNAIVSVIPFASYHIKMAVADVGDYIYDSEVMLKLHSFSCQPLQYSSSNSTKNITNNYSAKEDSSSVSIHITLPDTAITDINFHYQILGTAINGVDYQQIADSIFFPAGTITQSININPLHDTISESTEIISLILNSLNDTINVEILDNSILSPSGIGKSIDLKNLSILPNPATNILNIETTYSFNQYQIFDISGRLILSEKFSKTIDISGINTGVYFIKLINASNVLVKKFLKK